MKKPFDRMIGPEGDGDDPGQDAREEFMLRCLNAAVNLRGVLTCGELAGDIQP